MSADEDPAANEETDATDLKAQFRQALARKQGQHADGVSGSGPDANKIRDVHGRAGAKRQFRRKSGG